MEITCHLLSGTTFGRVSAISEIDLAVQLSPQTADHTLTIMDKGFYALGLLHHWQSSIPDNAAVTEKGPAFYGNCQSVPQQMIWADKSVAVLSAAI